MNNIFQKNINALAQKNETLAQELLTYIPTDVPELKQENGAYNLFYKIANDIYGNRKFDKNIEEEEGFVGKIVKDRGNDVRERDLKNGYGEKEVLKKDSKSNHCLGIIVKPKEEIKNIALEYKESLQHNMKKWRKEEFVDFMINLNQKYIYKF